MNIPPARVLQTSGGIGFDYRITPPTLPIDKQSEPEWFCGADGREPIKADKADAGQGRPLEFGGVGRLFM